MPARRGERQAPIGWWSEVRGSAPERVPLSRSQIVETARQILDAEGSDALTMRRLAQALHAGATSLYWHVKNKDQLLDLIVDEVLGEVRVDEDPSHAWRDRLAHLACEVHAVLTRHPHAALLLGSRVALGPHTLAVIDHTVGVLRAAGFDGTRLVLAYGALINYAAGSAILECRPLSGEDAAGETVEALKEQYVALLTALPAQRYPHLSQLASRLELTEYHQFEYGLARLLDGLAADLASSRDSSGRQEGNLA